MKKKIILTWDLDGFVGVVNSTFPYRYDFDKVALELEMVEQSLDFLKQYGVKTAFAVTGFSAEKGLYPYTFPDLIQRIAREGHEVASHSWRHEWVPIFSEKQVNASLQRSKSALENAVGNNYNLSGFVPPHNKPATWLSRGAYSLEDKGLYPLFKMGNLPNLLKALQAQNYKWVRTGYNPFINRFKKKEFTRTQRVYRWQNLLILENHYNGFDEGMIDYIENKNQEYFTVSAHPVMLSFTDGRTESWEKFEKFIKHFAQRNDVEFVLPMNVLKDFDL